jgi:hypothetical protein
MYQIKFKTVSFKPFFFHVCLLHPIFFNTATLAGFTDTASALMMAIDIYLKHNTLLHLPPRLRNHNPSTVEIFDKKIQKPNFLYPYKCSQQYQ